MNLEILRDPRVISHGDGGGAYEIEGVERLSHRWPPSVTDVVRGIFGGPDYSRVPEPVLERARQRGKHAHDLVAFESTDADLEHPEARFDQEAKEIAERVLVLMVSEGIEVYEAEVPLWSERLNVCGTLDLWTQIGGKWHVVDLKTTAKMDRDGWEYASRQVAAYCLLVYEQTSRLYSNGVMPRGAVIHAPLKGEATFREIEDLDSLAADFESACRIYHLKEGEG